MFQSVNFAIQQLQRLKKAMQQPELADFRPDGKTAVNVATLLTELEARKTTVMTRTVGLNNARGQVMAASAEVHIQNVDVYAGMRTVYRHDADSLRAIRRIPKKDQTPRDTLVRGGMTASAWATLPNMPASDPPTPFKLGPLTLALFTESVTALRTKIETCEGCDSEFEVAQGALTRIAMKDSKFVSAAVTLGRAQFAPGTEAREWIDTIPLDPSTQAPLQAIISVASSPAAGVVHLEFHATHATSFTIQHRLASDVEFVTVAADVTAESWDFVGLPAGNHQYIVFGTNSRGDGPVSEIATVPVAAAVAA